MQRSWRPIDPAAIMLDVHCHQGLPMIGKLLGHTQVQTTARYAHLATDPVKHAANQVSAEIANLLNGHLA